MHQIPENSRRGDRHVQNGFDARRCDSSGYGSVSFINIATVARRHM